jgi:anti-sigma factor RsiW
MSAPDMDSSPDMDASRYIEPDLATDLAALADGSLDPARGAEVARRVAASPELKAALAEQQQAISLLSRASEVTAPEPLREHVQELADRSRMPARRRADRAAGPPPSDVGRTRRRRALSVAAAGGLAAAAAAAIIAIAVSSGGASAPGLHRYLTAAARPATIAAPAESSVHPNELAIGVGDVAFPYWEDKFGWRATGARTDRVAGHAVTTVFYYHASGARIGYSIVAGPPPTLSRAAGRHGRGATVWRDGVRYWLGGAGDARVVVWTRSGHGCILSARRERTHDAHPRQLERRAPNGGVARRRASISPRPPGSRRGHPAPGWRATLPPLYRDSSRHAIFPLGSRPRVGAPPRVRLRRTWSLTSVAEPVITDPGARRSFLRSGVLL